MTKLSSLATVTALAAALLMGTAFAQGTQEIPARMQEGSSREGGAIGFPVPLPFQGRNIANRAALRIAAIA